MNKSEAIEKIREITRECPDLVVKVLTIDDVIELTGLDEEHKERIRASYVWTNWCLFNEFDVEDISNIHVEVMA